MSGILRGKEEVALLKSGTGRWMNGESRLPLAEEAQRS